MLTLVKLGSNSDEVGGVVWVRSWCNWKWKQSSRIWWWLRLQRIAVLIAGTGLR